MDTWYQYFLGYDHFGYTLYPDQRLTGPFNKPLVGIMLVRVLYLGLFATFVFDCLKSAPKNLMFTMMVLPVGLLTIFVSGERMAFMLGFSGFIAILLGFWMQYRCMRLQISVGFLMFLVLLTLACALNPSVSKHMIQNLVEKLMHFTSSDYGVVFNAAWRAWQENWWIGSGLHTYKQHCESLHLLASTDFDCTHAHNLYLQIGTETGLIGLILFTTMIVAIFLRALNHSIRQRHWFNSALVFSILNLSFWPLIGGISVLNNWVASLTWLGVGWSFTLAQIDHRRA